MSSLDDSFITWLNRPYLDLGSYQGGARQVHGIEFSYQNLVNGVSIPDGSIIVNPVTILHPTTFRDSLIRETRLYQYQVNNPLQLADELRTEKWHTLCNYLTHYQDLEPATKLRVIDLLSNLCLHHAVLKYVPEISESEIASSSTLAALAHCRAMSNLLSQPDAGALDNLNEFELIANHAPLNSKARFSVAIELVTFSAKTFGNLKAAEFWQSMALQELDRLKPMLNDFSYKYLLCIYHRAVVFVPLLQNNREAVIHEMNLCQSLAEDLIRKHENEIEQIAAYENLRTVFESRTKEAKWLGDIELAEERAKKLTQLEPFSSRFRLQLGEILIEQGKMEEAAKMYRSAARLGPPGTAIAWFMAGQCHEQLDELDIACDCYLSSIQMDELAISAVERLSKLAPRLGNSVLANWSNIRLLQLQEQQQIIANQSRTSYIPEASSALKIAGEKALAQI